MAENKAWAWLATYLEAGSNPLVYQVGDCLTYPVLLVPDSRMSSPSELGASGLSTSSLFSLEPDGASTSNVLLGI
eukprot:11795642-Ditylum_brightwellii.AAC.1